MTTRDNRIFTKHVEDTVTSGAGGADKHFVENMVDLYSELEAILGVDGQKPKVSKIIFHLRAYSEEVFSCMPVIVQTAGTLTDTVDIATGSIEGNIDSCCDDVFGYQVLRPQFHVAKRAPTSDSTSATGNEFALETTILVPGNILQILNKEVETERLQSIIFGFEGITTENSQTITFKVVEEIHFVGVRKRIVLR